MPTLRTFKPSWKDMSDFVVHFVKQTETVNAYHSIMGILSQSRIQARNPFGIAKTLAGIPGQNAVCFSEIPLDMLARLIVARNTSYGIGFRKQYVVDEGGGPILYAYHDTPHERAVRQMMKDAKGNPAAEIWKLTPFIDSAGARRGGGGPYLFEWEREWRHVGDFDFKASDVAFLLIPDDLHEAATGFFATAKEEHLGPSYECPFVDPKWKIRRMRRALK